MGLRQDKGQSDGEVRNIGSDVMVGNAHDNQAAAILNLNAGPLVTVQASHQKIFRNVKASSEELQLAWARGNNPYNLALFKTGDFAKMAILMFEEGQHEFTLGLINEFLSFNSKM